MIKCLILTGQTWVFTLSSSVTATHWCSSTEIIFTGGSPSTSENTYFSGFSWGSRRLRRFCSVVQTVLSAKVIVDSFVSIKTSISNIYVHHNTKPFNTYHFHAYLSWFERAVIHFKACLIELNSVFTTVIICGDYDCIRILLLDSCVPADKTATNGLT